MNVYSVLASGIGTTVEFVEALTVILAVGTVRGWKNSLTGAFTAVVILAGLLFAIGTPLVQVIQLEWVQLLVGVFMLLFGIRWLRKAILRYAGLKALHDESEAYEKEMKRQQGAGMVKKGMDPLAFSTTLSITFLEGLEAIFIVITFGLGSHAMSSSVIGGVIAVILVAVVGLVVRRPLTRVPENTMKFIVGLMLTSFGAFWVGEGMAVKWPQSDVSILYMVITMVLFSWVVVARCKKQTSHQTLPFEATMEVSK